MQIPTFAFVKITDNRLKTIQEFFRNELISIYGERETDELFFYWVNAKLGLTRSQMMAKWDEIQVESFVGDSVQAVERMKKHEPIQYILGFVEFAGCRLEVNKNVLIPRPETEELVYLLKEKFSSLKTPVILDLCTGSGCIAIGLKKGIPGAEVYASDLSEGALLLARKNSIFNDTAVSFEIENALEKPVSDRKYDLIVSNPPYIALSEKSTMRANVTDFEPEMALFVNDASPFLFYSKIIEYRSDFIKSGGVLAFEINEAFGKEVKTMLENTGKFVRIEVQTDMQGKDRFVLAFKPAVKNT